MSITLGIFKAILTAILQPAEDHLFGLSVVCEYSEVSLTDQRDVPSADVDRLVGERLRILRNSRGITQQQLASKIGICAQQVQKYERGANRIPAGRLWEISHVLAVDLNDFFFDMSKKEEEDTVSSKELLEIALALQSVKNDEVRESLINMIRICAKSAPENGGSEFDQERIVEIAKDVEFRPRKRLAREDDFF